MAKSKKVVARDPGRYQRKVPPGPMQAVFAAQPQTPNAEYCNKIEDLLNKRLFERCASKEFEQTAGNCPAGGGATAPVDLVVVIDTSGSMNDEATDLSNAADAAVQAAAQSCPSDLRVAWFGIEGTWPGTKFTQTYRDYLHGLVPPIADADIVGTPVGVGGEDAKEDGAAAVIDLSDHFDWRVGAARAIFYLGDEALEGGDPQNAADVAAADAAITAANINSVKVFTYFGTGSGDPVTTAEYARLANLTGGQAFAAPVANLGGFQTVLEQIICNSPEEACSPIEEPKVIPCLRLRWGDGPRDQIETEDTEVLCITVCNPYSNVVMKDFVLHLGITDAGGGAVATLPDGTPSVMVKPEYMICFGDIPPCDPNDPDNPSCVSREVVLISRSAAQGVYNILTAYCFDACFTMTAQGETFKLELHRS